MSKQTIGSCIVNADRLVGVIGGMGPEATVDFMARVIAATPAQSDQDHIRMLVEHNPRIPSRQSAVRRDGEDPGTVLASIAARLQIGGADFIVMPCNLAHAWTPNIQSAISIPFVSIIDVTVARALSHTDGGAIGLLTTPGCFSAELYQHALADHEIVLQSSDELAAAMGYVKQIKAGDKSEKVAQGLRRLAEDLVTRGAQTLVAACTEFPLVLEESMFSVPFVSSTDVLAEKTVELALSDEPFPSN